MKNALQLACALMLVGQVISKFAPFLGEAFGMLGVLILLVMFLAVLFAGMAERGY